MKKDDGGAAFARPMGNVLSKFNSAQEGMSLRDYFAGQANASWIIALAMRRNEPGYTDESAAIEAARLASISADAMLEAREKE